MRRQTFYGDFMLPATTKRTLTYMQGLLCPILIHFDFLVNFHENPIQISRRSVLWEPRWYLRSDRQTYTMKVIDDFCDCTYIRNCLTTDYFALLDNIRGLFYNKWLITQSTVLIDKLTVSQPVKKSQLLYAPLTVHHSVHNSSSHDPKLSHTNPKHVAGYYVL